MFAIRRRTAGRDAPRWPFSINWDSPLTQGLMFLWHPGGPGGRFMEHVRGYHGIPSTGGLIKPSEHNHQFHFDVAGDGYATINEAAQWIEDHWPGGTDFTAAFWGVRAAQDWNNAMSIDSTSDDHALYLGGVGGSDNIHFRTQHATSGNQSFTTSGLTFDTGKVHHVVGRILNGTKTVLLDTEKSTSGASFSGDWDVNGVGALGAFRGGTKDYWDGPMWLMGLWDRGLQDAAVYALYDPETRWELLYELGRKAFFFPAPAAVEYSRRLMGAGL